MSPPDATGRCTICHGPLLPELVELGRHEVDLTKPDNAAITAMREPGRRMAARQRVACEQGRIAATRGVPAGAWAATATPVDEPYPCRCAEVGDWAHTHGRCPCAGRTDVENLPHTCCAYIAAPGMVEQDEPGSDFVPEVNAAKDQFNLEPDPLNVHLDEDEPRSTVDELRIVLIDYELARPRTQQLTPGPSELGTPCLAQLVRKLAGMRRRDLTEPAWAPFAGTAVHREMELVIAHWNAELGRQRWIAEDTLDCGAGITGHGDAFDLDNDMVVDWKYVGATALSKLLSNQRAGRPPAEQVSQDYRIQAHLYGAGHAAKGRTVRWVRLVLLPRSWRYDDAGEWTEAYDPALARWALERYSSARGLVAALELDGAHPERIAMVPRTPTECAWCPFHRPGAANDATGCPGDELRAVKAVQRVGAGLLTTVTTTDVI